MWPDHFALPRGTDHAPADPIASRHRAGPSSDDVAAILEELRAIPAPPHQRRIAPTLLAQVLRDLAPAVYGRPSSAQLRAIASVARDHRLPVATLSELAHDTGALIGRTTHQQAPRLPGKTALNRLLTADLDLAADLVLARTTLADALAHSDPDLPRLWILANGLHHAVPPDVLTAVPARSHGPIARLIPVHDDLTSWPGIRRAVEQLQITVDAAQQGRQWLARNPARTRTRTRTAVGSMDLNLQHLVALGVLHLTHPRTAYEIVLHHPATPDLGVLRHIVSTLSPITGVLDLSDPALKAVCDRNNWLLGTPDEHAHRQLIRRRTTGALNGDIRTYLASGDITTLTDALIRQAPADSDLDHLTWPRKPPAVDTVQRRHLLDIASREAIHHFTGLRIEPHPTRVAALTARFPDHFCGKDLHVSPDRLLTTPAPDVPGADLDSAPPDLAPGL